MREMLARILLVAAPCAGVVAAYMALVWGVASLIL